MDKTTTKKVALMAMMIALAMIFSYVEAVLIPFSFGVPGIKLGLANLAIVAALYLLGVKEAFVISIVRVILNGILFGNMAAVLYSLAGCLLSLAVMALLKRSKHFSVVAVSVVGGVCHNVGQLLVAMWVVENLNLVLYLPVLLIAGVITGLIIGVVCRLILPAVRKAFQTS